MSKAEEDFEMIKKAKKHLPDGGYSKKELNLAFYMFDKGYHQAEKDLELTWEDMRLIDRIASKLLLLRQEDDRDFYQEVLKRFKEMKKN